jgi:uncharacterized protein
VKALAAELLRTVIVDGALVPDLRGGLAGRGAWLHPNLDCLRQAERRRAFHRALRAPGPLDVEAVRAHLSQRDSERQTARERPVTGSTREAGRPVMSQP